MTWGIFTQRCSFFGFVFEGKRVTLSNLDHVPLLHTVSYQLSDITQIYVHIIDAKRLEWNENIRFRLYPSLPISATRSEREQNGLERWNFFDLEFHLQRLIPHRPVAEFTHYFYPEGRNKPSKLNLEGLVRNFGGVNPLTLRRLLPQEPGLHPLVFEAHVLNLLTDAMKTCGRVWMKEANLQRILVQDDNYKRCLHNLVAVGVIETGELGLAFTWATKLFRQNYVAIFVYVKDAYPITLSASLTGSIEADPSFSIDKWVDMHRLPVSVFIPLIPDHYDYPLVDCIDEAYQIFENMRGSDPMKTSLVISNAGWKHFDLDGYVTCVSVSKPFVTRVFRNVQTDSIYNNFKPLHSVSFQNLFSVNSQFDFVFALATKETPRRWLRDATRFKNLVIFALK